ncbi:MAG: NAD(P)/FAD-dependent oxidoreductase [Candidatus Dadabacteria bacterium]|nr:MAG: NAD(P)/FAD-dependent oxidoreductase [Candidatus Dadabacteria bacterium]
MSNYPEFAEYVVVGGGYGGLAAAYELAKNGEDVVLLEAEEELGGLAGTFKTSEGLRIDKFYHHWFTSDKDIFLLLKEIGCEEKIVFMPSVTGFYWANSIFRLASPFDLLKFSALSFPARVRTGLMVLAARWIRDWQKLEEQTAVEWILKYAGRESYETIWKPLLKGKFGEYYQDLSAVWFWNKMKLRGSSRGKGGKELLAYYRGGFAEATEDIKKAVLKAGAKIFLNSAVKEIKVQGNRVAGVIVNNAFIKAQKVIATVPLPIFLSITSGLSEEWRKKCEQVKYLGNICLVLRLKRSLSSTYWLNVADPDFPFVGIIEHTNFDLPQYYKGQHIVYLSKYLPVTNFIYNFTAEEFFNFSFPYIKKMFPQFSKEWVLGMDLWKSAYSQPLITKNYSLIKPSFTTPVKGLWLTTMAQVYPEDRGTSYAVKNGRQTARLAMES